jgi:hypothetical protein
MSLNLSLLKEKPIDVADLLLDPNNPRFSKHLDEITPLGEVAKKNVQDITFKRMKDRDNHFEIGELVDAIMEDGFIPVDKIFVQQVGDKFLVVEGNRRVTAIKTILEEHGDEISDTLRKQISEVPCVIVDMDKPDARNMVRKILGLRHHGSILPWKPLPAAFNLYQEYMLDLCSNDSEKAKNPNNFVYHPATAKRVAAMFSVRLTDVRSKVRLYRVYLQLVDMSGNSPDVINADAFSMLEETLGRNDLKTYFGYDENQSTFSEEGAEKMLDLYFGLKENPPVITEASAGTSNVRDFAFVVAEGTEEDVRRITENREKAGDVKTTVAAKVLKHTLQHTLEIVLNELDKVNLGDIGLDGFAPNETEKIALIDKKINQLKRAAGLN